MYHYADLFVGPRAVHLARILRPLEQRHVFCGIVLQPLAWLAPVEENREHLHDVVREAALVFLERLVAKSDHTLRCDVANLQITDRLEKLEDARVVGARALGELEKLRAGAIR